jgi:AcrR family transcriptional regulator
MKTSSLKRRRSPVARAEQLPQATREKILAASAPLFASMGVHDVTIRKIAAAARVNSQLIYYYFRDKDGLFHAVLEAAAARVSGLLSDASAEGANPRDRLAHFVEGWVRVSLAESEALRMLYRAMLDGDKKLIQRIQLFSGDHAAQIAALVESGQRMAIFRSDVDARRAVASLVGMVQYPALAESIVFSAAKLERNTAERDAFAKHTAELFLRGLDVR